MTTVRSQKQLLDLIYKEDECDLPDRDEYKDMSPYRMDILGYLLSETELNLGFVSMLINPNTGEGRIHKLHPVTIPCLYYTRLYVISEKGLEDVHATLLHMEGTSIGYFNPMGITDSTRAVTVAIEELAEILGLEDPTIVAEEYKWQHTADDEKCAAWVMLYAVMKILPEDGSLEYISSLSGAELRILIEKWICLLWTVVDALEQEEIYSDFSRDYPFHPDDEKTFNLI